jgi:hypothetical protein
MQPTNLTIGVTVGPEGSTPPSPVRKKTTPTPDSAQRGIITDDEYKNKRAEILKDM